MIPLKEEDVTVPQEIMIRSIKNNFFLQTGKHIKIVACERWESMANFTFDISAECIVKMIFDFNHWNWYMTYPLGRTWPPKGNRKIEKVIRRALIDYIATNNGCTLMSLAVLTNRDHTTVMHSIKNFESMIETDSGVRKMLLETVEHCRNNYYAYRAKKYTKEDLMVEED